MCLVDAFESYRPLLFTIASRLLDNATEAEDMVQEAYCRIQAADEQEIRSPRAYLCRIVTRLCLDTLKSARTTHEHSLNQWQPDQFPDVENDLPLQTALQHESISRAWHILLERLTPQERAVFVLHEVFEYPYPHIASMLGLNAAHCRQIFHRAQQHLAADRPRFVSPPDAHLRAVERFLAATHDGDLPPLTALLADDMLVGSSAN